MDKLLVVDDSLPFLSDVEALLADTFHISTATNAQECLQLLRDQNFSAVLLDLYLPDMYGTDVLKKIHNDIDPLLPVFIITNHHNTDHVVEAMRHGAYDFIPKNFSLNLLGQKIKKALERRSLEVSNRVLQSEYLSKNKFICQSKPMRKVNLEVTRLSRLNVDVLIFGETGVGKDLIASMIHTRSERANKPFIPVSIRSLSDTLIESELFGHEKGSFSGADRLKIGKFEAANNGTVYIPEISSLSDTVQLKLLHFMQYKTITRVGQDPTKSEIKLDVRLIMATNEDLTELVKKGKIRSDFYHRITGVTLNIPPLRERTSDIEPLAEYYTKMYAELHPAGHCKLSPEVIDAFYQYNWPGNIREFANSIKHAIVYADDTTLTLDNFPHLLKSVRVENESNDDFISLSTNGLPGFRDAEKQFKTMYFKRLWEKSGHNLDKTAQMAGFTTHATRRILRSLGIRK